MPAISKFAAQILKKIAAGRPARLAADGSAQVGTQAVPASVVAALRAADLARAHDGAIAVTEAGRAFLRRRETPPRPAAGEAVEAFRAQHLRLARGDRPERRTAVVNLAESPLGWLARRRGRAGRPLLAPEQIEAGERLRADFELAGLSPKITRAYDAPPVARGRRGAQRAAEFTARQIDARRRVAVALEAVGPGLADALLRTCCFLEGLEEAERALGWPARSGKLVLGLALDRLALHYAGGRRARPTDPGGQKKERPKTLQRQGTPV